MGGRRWTKDTIAHVIKVGSTGIEKASCLKYRGDSSAEDIEGEENNEDGDSSNDKSDEET